MRIWDWDWSKFALVFEGGSVEVCEGQKRGNQVIPIPTIDHAITQGLRTQGSTQ